MFLILSVLLISFNFYSTSSFTFLGNLKLPEIQSVQKFIDGQKFGDKKICVITGTSSGLGRQTAKHLLKKGGWHVICAVRDVEKMNLIAELDEFNKNDYTVLECDLASFASVRKFVDNLKEFKCDRPLDRLVCNAAVYQPSLDYAKYTEDGIEQQMQINFLSHFLLSSLLIDDMRKANKPRLITVGSVTGNDNTVGGGGVYPVADLHNLEGLAQGAKEPISMMDGRNFNGAKAYKDSKLAIMMFSNILHEKYHRGTGIAFSSIYPGCIAESPLFREKRPWFRKYFPVFMKYITGGFVGEEEAGQRLYQVIVDPRCTKSGVYWSWNGGPREGRGADAIKNKGQIVGAGGAGGDWESIFENDQSDKVHDAEKSFLLWKHACEITESEWPLAKAPVSPCPTLKVIAFATYLIETYEELTGKKSQVPVALASTTTTPTASTTTSNLVKPATMGQFLGKAAF